MKLERSYLFRLTDASWFAHRFVESEDKFRFRRLTRARIDVATFLTDDVLGQDPGTVDVPVATILDELPARPLAIVFHSAFCGSTLLTKALSRPGLAIGLSEPMMLNDFAGWRIRGSGGAAVARAADAGLRLLARPFGTGETVVAKASNIANPLAELLLALNPHAKSIFLYVPLETFLISVARKGIACRAWVRTLAECYLPLGMFAPLALTAADLFRQTDLQLAASCWLAQQAWFAQLLAKNGPSRLRSMNADRMLADPAMALTQVAQHFDLAMTHDEAKILAAGQAFQRHSKDGSAFSTNARQAQYASTRETYCEEIETVMDWANEFARRLAVPADLPHGLC